MSLAGGSLRSSLRAGDGAAIEALVRSTGFFNDEEIAVARELADDAWRGGPDSHYRFVLADGKNLLAGYACFGRVPCTASAWDLYWIAVGPAFQGQGLGRQLLGRVEHLVQGSRGTDLFAETSSRTQYEPTRRFYARAGFLIAADIPDFYSAGDAKIIFRKRL